MPLEQSRNSGLRTLVKEPLNKFASSLVKKIPGLTADHITYSGTGLVTFGTLVKTLSESRGVNNNFAALALIGLGVALDGLDGAVARQKNQDEKSSHGVIVDVLNDRSQETIMAVSRIATATMRRDPVGVLAATLAGLTNPLPSLLRSYSEKEGKVVAESGKNPLSFLGTRVGRSFLGTAATVYPNTNLPLVDSPLQPVIDGLTTVANITTSVERVFCLLKKSDKSELDPVSQQIAAEKNKALLKFTAINTLVVLASGMIGLDWI
jgi:phosphatidylglycerophosphate synthase